MSESDLNLLNPLYSPTYDNGRRRILSDRGIRSAIEAGPISITPGEDVLNDSRRIQPATLDVKISGIESYAPLKRRAVPLNHGENANHGEKTVLLPGCGSRINLTERISTIESGPFYRHSFLNPLSEARSSLRRLGVFMLNSGECFFQGGNKGQIELGNFSSRSIVLDGAERVAQLFFTVEPFADRLYLQQASMGSKSANELGEKVRALEMGVSIPSDECLEYLHKNAYFEIKPSLKKRRGLIIFHAGKNAYRLKKSDEQIVFSKGKEYFSSLFEPIDISKGYTITPFEHVVIETKESMKLSPNVGIWFWDNLIDECSDVKGYSHMRERKAVQSKCLWSLPDGWADPGYEGLFTRQPKWLSQRSIKPGDVRGFGIVFYFPNPVGRAYGDVALGSQYLKR